MKVIRSRQLQYIPASHEDMHDPGVWKKILFMKDDLLDGRVQMINWACLPAGSSFRFHFHEDMEEVFIIMKGKVRMRVKDEEDVLTKGDEVIVPVGHAHRMTNLGKRDALYMVIGISLGKSGRTLLAKE